MAVHTTSTVCPHRSVQSLPLFHGVLGPECFFFLRRCLAKLQEGPGSEKIAMTSPVAAEMAGDGSYKVSHPPVFCGLLQSLPCSPQEQGSIGRAEQRATGRGVCHSQMKAAKTALGCSVCCCWQCTLIAELAGEDPLSPTKWWPSPAHPPGLVPQHLHLYPLAAAADPQHGTNSTAATAPCTQCGTSQAVCGWSEGGGVETHTAALPWAHTAGAVVFRASSPPVPARTFPLLTHPSRPSALVFPLSLHVSLPTAPPHTHCCNFFLSSQVSFVMPSKYTLGTLPKPHNPSITIREVPSRTLAAISFSGKSPREPDVGGGMGGEGRSNCTERLCLKTTGLLGEKFVPRASAVLAPWEFAAEKNPTLRHAAVWSYRLVRGVGKPEYELHIEVKACGVLGSLG